MLNDNIFAFSFEKKPDLVQWRKLKNKLPASYTLPDPELIMNLHRSNLTIHTIPISDWFMDDSKIRRKDMEELNQQFKHLLPPNYTIPDAIRLKNILMK